MKMKKLALLSVVTLLLATAVFAPVAMAQTAGEVDIQGVTLGPQGFVTVRGTVQCTEGRYYYVSVSVWQRSIGNRYNYNNDVDSGQCATSGPTSFTVTTFGLEGPFHRGPAAVTWWGAISDDPYYCDPNAGCVSSEGLEEVRIR